MNIQMIPLSQLVPSAANVRKTGAHHEIEALAASIAAHGLLQNLQVRAVAKGKFEVVAGGRRLAALKSLVKQKTMTAKSEIPCHVLNGEDAGEISLAENLLRLPMHPADQFEAFRAMSEAGKGVEDIAARFGTTVTTVRQRLKLAAVSPRLFELYRDDELSLDQLMAFTVSDDFEAQEAAWFDSPAWRRDPQALRRALTASQVEADDLRVSFVGLEAYQKEGGGIFRDLFQPEHEGYLTDPALLDRLVAQKLESEAAAVRHEGWGWVEIMPDFDHAALGGMGRVYPESKPLAPDVQEEINHLSFRHDYLAEEYGDEADEDMQAQLEELLDKIEQLSETEEVWEPKVMAQAGAIVAIGHDGKTRVERGLVRREDKKTVASLQISERETNTSFDPAASLPSSLVEALTAERTAALRVLLKDNLAVSLASVAYALALPVFYSRTSRADSCLDLRLASRDLRLGADNGRPCKAADEVDASLTAWEGQLPERAEDLFAWLLQQPAPTIMALIALCAAMSVNAVRGKQDRPNAPRLVHADELAAALGLDMAAWWQPTKENFLGRVPKKLVLAAVAEAVSPQAAENLADLKKDALAAQAQERLAGKGWLPALLRAPEFAEPEEEKLAA
ncbi:MAG TPA: hypothetical protein DCY07_00385 [Rhodospirillaceae bacterium]|nr:hypothetical protein [Rhodospirillaceae bacterium]